MRPGFINSFIPSRDPVPPAQVPQVWDFRRETQALDGWSVFGIPTGFFTGSGGARTELASLTGLPFAELVPLGTVIFEVSNGYTNTVKARIVSVSIGVNYVDFRPAGFFSK